MMFITFTRFTNYYLNYSKDALRIFILTIEYIFIYFKK